jgi:hypothetical protein
LEILARDAISSMLVPAWPAKSLRIWPPLLLLICVTPFFGGIFSVLFAAQASRGWLQGVVQDAYRTARAQNVRPCSFWSFAALLDQWLRPAIFALESS